MNLNEIKKALYKEKPDALIVCKTNTTYAYVAMCSLGAIGFDVPIADMGETIFKETEPAQLLIRYISGAFSNEVLDQIEKIL